MSVKSHNSKHGKRPLKTASPYCPVIVPARVSFKVAESFIKSLRRLQRAQAACPSCPMYWDCSLNLEINTQIEAAISDVVAELGLY